MTHFKKPALFLNPLPVYSENFKKMPLIKKSAAPKDAVKNFSVLKPIEREPSEEERFTGTAHLKTDIGTGAVICLASDVLPIDNKNWYIPAWLI